MKLESSLKQFSPQGMQISDDVKGTSLDCITGTDVTVTMGTTSNRVCIECNDELPEMSSDQPKTLCYQLTDMISLSLSSDSGNTEMLNLSLCSRARAFCEVAYASRRHV